MRNTKKQILKRALGAIITVSLTCSYCVSNPLNTYAKTTLKEQTQIYATTLGNSGCDSTIVSIYGNITVVDLGEDSSTSQETATALWSNDLFNNKCTIDNLIISHHHIDHTRGLKKLAVKAEDKKTDIYIKNIFINGIDYEGETSALYKGLKEMLMSDYVHIGTIYITGIYGGNVNEKAELLVNDLNELKASMAKSKINKNVLVWYTRSVPMGASQKTVENTTFYSNGNVYINVDNGNYGISLLQTPQYTTKKDEFLFEISPNNEQAQAYYNKIVQYIQSLIDNHSNYLDGKTAEQIYYVIRNKLMSAEFNTTNTTETCGRVQLGLKCITRFSMRAANMLAGFSCVNDSTGDIITTGPFRRDAELLMNTLLNNSNSKSFFGEDYSATKNDLKDGIIDDSRLENDHSLVTVIDDKTTSRAFRLILPGDMSGLEINNMLNNNSLNIYFAKKQSTSITYNKVFYKAGHHGNRMRDDFFSQTSYENNYAYYSEYLTAEKKLLLKLNPSCVVGNKWGDPNKTDMFTGNEIMQEYFNAMTYQNPIDLEINMLKAAF